MYECLANSYWSRGIPREVFERSLANAICFSVAKLLMETIPAHPDLQGLRRRVLATRDAHGLYARYGFTPLHHADRFMERWSPQVYQR